MNCVNCGSLLRVDSGEAEPDFSDKFCSSGCYMMGLLFKFDHLRNVYDATIPKADQK